MGKHIPANELINPIDQSCDANSPIGESDEIIAPDFNTGGTDAPQPIPDPKSAVANAFKKGISGIGVEPLNMREDAILKSIDKSIANPTLMESTMSELKNNPDLMKLAMPRLMAHYFGAEQVKDRPGVFQIGQCLVFFSILPSQQDRDERSTDPADLIQNSVFFSVPSIEQDGEKRTTDAAELIQKIVACLPAEEQRAAKIKALVGSVPAKTTYPQQIQAFGAITHTMRVLIGKQMAPLLREFLKDSSPRADPNLDHDRKAQNADLALRKRSFSERLTSEIVGLGLMAKWKDIPCYFGSGVSSNHSRGVYRIIKIGDSGHICEFAEWDVSRTVSSLAKNRVDDISLVDAAPPGEKNLLTPIRNRLGSNLRG